MNVERVKEMFMQYGMTAQVAQLVEKQLVHLLVTGEVLDGQEITMETIARAKLSLDIKTLGGLMSVLKKQVEVNDPVFEVLLSEVLKKRNDLAHNFFARHEPVINTPEGIEKMILELQSTRQLFRRADDLLEIIRQRALTRLGESANALEDAFRDFARRN